VFERVYEKEGVGESMLVCVGVCFCYRGGGGILFTVSYPWVAPNPCSFNIFFKIGQISFFSPKKKTFFQSIFHLCVSYECGQVSLQGPHVPIKVSN